MAIENQEKWLAHEVSGISKEDEGECPQEKFKMGLRPPKASSSGIAEYYLSLFQEETGYISNIEKDLISEETKDKIIKPLAQSKIKELENESAIITEDTMDQVCDRDIKRRMKQRM
ncbi:hypothetical protein O181_014983 [Austropuccinia psidii MF-1]|uniref:Uncharacterized protein n=1 Tax=Austropuccinia psidii MF-1 TaxID=1389203 RepID=A0A9Q3GPJ2_9BASI|nr:hypothetical protein [Austropuccinia psidii MF-1]